MKQIIIFFLGFILVSSSIHAAVVAPTSKQLRAHRKAKATSAKSKTLIVSLDTAYRSGIPYCRIAKIGKTAPTYQVYALTGDPIILVEPGALKYQQITYAAYRLQSGVSSLPGENAAYVRGAVTQLSIAQVLNKANLLGISAIDVSKVRDFFLAYPNPTPTKAPTTGGPGSVGGSDMPIMLNDTFIQKSTGRKLVRMGGKDVAAYTTSAITVVGKEGFKKFSIYKLNGTLVGVIELPGETATTGTLYVNTDGTTQNLKVTTEKSTLLEGLRFLVSHNYL